MTFDFSSLIKKKYQIVPLDRNFIQPSKIPGKEQILWVGCSDSSVEETDALNVPRGEIFVHRNLGNIVSNGDLSSESAIAWCLDLLKVKHIIVCGHYDCALIDKGDGTELGGWHKYSTLAALENGADDPKKRNESTSDEREPPLRIKFHPRLRMPTSQTRRSIRAGRNGLVEETRECEESNRGRDADSCFGL